MYVLFSCAYIYLLISVAYIYLLISLAYRVFPITYLLCFFARITVLRMATLQLSNHYFDYRHYYFTQPFHFFIQPPGSRGWVWHFYDCYGKNITTGITTLLTHSVSSSDSPGSRGWVASACSEIGREEKRGRERQGESNRMIGKKKERKYKRETEQDWEEAKKEW